MLRHPVAGILAHIGQTLVEGAIERIALGRQGTIYRGLGDGALALGRPHPLKGIPGGQGHLHGAGVGVADIFRGDRYQSPRHIERIAAPIKHAAVPVQGTIGR